MGDAEHSRALLKLLEIPDAERDEAWRERLTDAALGASFSRPAGPLVHGAGGFPYVALRVPFDPAVGPETTIQALLDECLEKIAGIVINAREGDADWAFSFGEVWAIRQVGAPWPPAQEAPPSPAAHPHKLMAGPPSADFLPPYARRAAASFLRSTGIERPQVLALVDSVSMARHLVFNVFPDDFETEEELRRFADAFAWFFPADRPVAFLQRENPFADRFVDLVPQTRPERPSDPLWGWLAADAARLRGDGKAELADLFDQFVREGEDRALFERGAALAEALGEARWELFFRHWAVQQGLFREPLPLDKVLDEAVKLKALAGLPACEDCPQRFCAQESLFNTYFLIDPKGYAPEVARASEKLAAEIPADLDCRRCFLQLRADAFIEQGRHDEARAACRQLLADTPKSDAGYLNALLTSAKAAEATRDAAAMRGAIDEASAWLADPASSEVNEDNVWSFWAQEARLRLLEGDLPAALEGLRRIEGSVPEGCADRIRLEAALARAEARAGRPTDACGRAAGAAERALKRGMLRDAAEALLVAAEAAAQAGDESSRADHARRLAEVLPKLKTHDLDVRATAVGAHR